VRVSESRVTGPIPSGFIGFSFEFQAVRDYTGSDPRAINPVLVQLIRDVAPDQTPVLRIGGNSTDQSWWPSPDVTPSPGVIYTLDKSWLATTRALAVATGAKLILGVNLKLDNPAEAAAEAHAYRTGIGTRHIEALEIGNEPELYKVFPYYEAGGAPVFARPPTYDFATYAHDVAQIARRIPGFALAGPATGTPQWLARVPQLFAAEPRLKVISYHRYPLLACFSQPGDSRYPSIPNLLSSDSARDLLGGIGDAISIAHRHGATVRIDELNSVACAGQPGVSDTFASALWMLDSLFALARAGVDGVNIHTLPGASYEPFVFRRIRGRWLATVRPEYYSLLMFEQAASPGARMLALRQTSSTDVRSRATVTRDGEIHVVLINDSLTSGHVALVKPPAPAREAVLERLEGPDAAATDDVTLAGQTFGNETGTGTLKGKRGTVRVAPDRRGRYLIRLPASSAAMLTFLPAATSPPPGPRTGAPR
jgi:Glycosyl hydrolase family 79 C-terminal beta domain